MSRPTTLPCLIQALRQSELVEESQLESYLATQPLPDDVDEALAVLTKHGLITAFHARHLREGRVRGFRLGNYRVLQPLGRGGMGLVYLAEQLSMSRQVAIKVLRTELHRRRGARERFAREARATAALTHPNIVRIYDVQHEGDTYFLVMEHVEGQSLSKKIAQQGRVAVPVAIDIVCQAAEGLRHAHQCGIIHRDIKPSNLLIDKQGTVKLLDMGLARFFEDATDNLTERMGGGALGSPDYLAPEQARHQADIRSDIYALGATFYCLLVGEPPFASLRGSAKILAHQTRPVVPPAVRDPSIPQEISVIVLKMLAKAPEDRYQSVSEVLVALSSYRKSLPESGTARVDAPAVEKAKSRYRVWHVGALLGIALAGGGLAVGLGWLLRTYLGSMVQ